MAAQCGRKELLGARISTCWAIAPELRACPQLLHVHLGTVAPVGPWGSPTPPAETRRPPITLVSTFIPRMTFLALPCPPLPPDLYFNWLSLVLVAVTGQADIANWAVSFPTRQRLTDVCFMATTGFSGSVFDRIRRRPRPAINQITKPVGRPRCRGAWRRTWG